MMHVDSFLDRQEKKLFYSCVHLFAMNSLVNLQNRKMLKSLNCPIARCLSECTTRTKIGDNNDDFLERALLLHYRECIMLTCNLLVEVGFINGAFGCVEDIFYTPSSKLPQLPQFATVLFEKYFGVIFDRDCPNGVSIVPVVRGNVR